MTPITINGVNYLTNHKRYYAREVEGQREVMRKEDWHAIVDPYLEEQKALAEQTKEELPAEDTPDTPAEEKAEEPKKRTHPTADAFLAAIPKDKYVFRTNNKGHILISKVEGDKTAYARIRPLKDGAWVFPGKELKATRSDWEFHEGWANEYALKVSNWDGVAEVLGF